MGQQLRTDCQKDGDGLDSLHIRGTICKQWGGGQSMNPTELAQGQPTTKSIIEEQSTNLCIYLGPYTKPQNQSRG